jgi:hypothetical protein
LPPYLSGGSTRLFEPVRGSLAWAGGPPTPQPAQPAVTGTFPAASGEATPGRRREAYSPGGTGPESRRDFSNLSGGLQSDAKELSPYQAVTLASPARPIPQDRRPPRNGHRPEWAASDAGLGDTALNSSPCSVAQTRGRVAEGDAPCLHAGRSAIRSAKGLETARALGGRSDLNVGKSTLR